MTDNIERIKEEARSKLSAVTTSDELEQLRVHLMGKKGLITGLLHQLGELDADKRRELGAALNQLKIDIDSALNRRKSDLLRTELDRMLTDTPAIDVTLPGRALQEIGSIHPINRVIDQAVQCLKRIGFSIASGPEVETEFYNFEALNTPEGHPARDLQDTFYLQPGVVLRSHTSPVQIRAMQSRRPPIQAIAVGKVYRSDYDITHTPMFHQMEGLMVDKHITFGDLKGVLSHLVGDLFGTKKLRFRPSYFPFTEPSAEVDMQCFACRGNAPDCRICKGTGWIEIGGCGMVHPNVFRAVEYPTDEYSGFAFGMGIERIAMLKYGIDDLRSFFENDYRMLEQF